MNFDDQRELRTAKFRAQKAHDAEAHCWAEVKKKMSSLFVDLLDNACEAHTFHSLLYEHWKISYELKATASHHRRRMVNDEMNNCVMIFIEFVCAHLRVLHWVLHLLLHFYSSWPRHRQTCEYRARESEELKITVVEVRATIIMKKIIWDISRAGEALWSCIVSWENNVN